MFVLRFIVIVPLLAVAGCGDGVGAGALAASGAPALSGPSADRICETVTAIATGFGEQQVRRFAFDNLDLSIDEAKDELARKGAKGFAVDDRAVRCVDYIDFGGALGREHKCRATARICGKTV
jgi:hypothetical protein